MTTSNWNTATTDEKLEELKKDVKTAFDAINTLLRNQTNAANHLTDVKQTLNTVVKAIDQLEKNSISA